MENIKEKVETKALSQDAVMCWVAVSENKPEVGQWLLVCASSGRYIAWYNGLQFEDRAGYNIEGVTHWMQIPEPPCK